MDVGSIIESSLPWFNAAGFMAFIGFIVRAWFASRKLRMAEDLQDGQMLAAKKLQDMQGYGPLISALQSQVTTLQDELGKVRRDLNACQDDHLNTKTSHLREKGEMQAEIIALRAEVRGLRDQLIAHSQTVAVALGASELVIDAGQRAVDIQTPPV